jgi:KDO2-lipid IV(A) lauroyltransferase
MNAVPTQFRVSQFIGPKFWPTWFVLGLMWLTAQLPFAWQLRIGAMLGRAMYMLSKRRRHIAATNIALAFPNRSSKEQKILLKANFRSTGIALIEVGLAWWGSQKRLRRLVHTEGLEHIQQALELGKGVIMLGGHFTTLIISGRLLAMELPFNIVIKKSHNKLFEAMMSHYRKQQYQGLIDTTDMRSLLKTLRNNKVCWYAPDQDFGNRQSVFAQFMGINTVTLTTTARLAKTTGASVVYIDFERLPNAQGYQLTLHPALQDFPSGDDIKDARRVNALIEKHVHEAPDQYLWIHRRFKTRPPGELGFYGYADSERNKRNAEEAAKTNNV